MSDSPVHDNYIVCLVRMQYAKNEPGVIQSVGVAIFHNQIGSTDPAGGAPIDIIDGDFFDDETFVIVLRNAGQNTG